MVVAPAARIQWQGRPGYSSGGGECNPCCNPFAYALTGQALPRVTGVTPSSFSIFLCSPCSAHNREQQRGVFYVCG